MTWPEAIELAVDAVHSKLVLVCEELAQSFETRRRTKAQAFRDWLRYLRTTYLLLETYYRHPVCRHLCVCALLVVPADPN